MASWIPFRRNQLHCSQVVTEQGRFEPVAIAGAYALVATVFITALVSHSGNSLPAERVDGSGRFCSGQCICDGGSTDEELMSRVCPKGWEKVLRRARRDARRIRRARRLRKQRQQPPDVIPSV